MEDSIYLNPLEDRLIGAVNGHVYFKPEYRDYIIVTTEKEYLELVKEYIKTKRDFCERYNHFCGVFGEFYAEKYKKRSDIILNEYVDVEDDGKNDGIKMVEVPYPTYLVERFSRHCDMEHG